MARGRAAGCLAGVLLILIVVGAALWAFRADLRWPGSGGDADVQVSLEAADAAELKIRRLRENGDTARLSEVELASLIRYRLADQQQFLMRDPTIALRGDTLRIGARVPSDRLPHLRELERIRAFLPDTTQVDLEGQLRPLGGGRSAIEVDQVRFAGFPVPSRFYPDVLERLGRRDEPGLAPNAIAVPLPAGVGSARVQDGNLILTP